MAQTATWTIDESVSQPTEVACGRCGIFIPFNTIAKRQSRGNTDDRCADCRATESGKGGSNSRGVHLCLPWHGDIDLDTMQPLKANGQPHMPGIRTCGHLDCCNRRHVISFEALEAERHDLSYRTGQRRDFTQLLAAVKKEGN